MRLQAVSKCFSSFSMPMKRLPSRMQATPVVPVPMKESTISSPFVVRTRRRMISSGLTVGCANVLEGVTFDSSAMFSTIAAIMLSIMKPVLGTPTGTGVGPNAIDFVLGIVKAYTTRVGSGPFPTELFDEMGQHLAVKGNEVGTTTGRSRRCGWFDAVALRHAIQINSVSGICLTKLDVLDGMDTVKVCVGYKLNGEMYDRLPAGVTAQANVEPVYETLPGWKETTAGARKWNDLPAQAIKYVRHVEELVSAPVALLSTSPERDDTILVRDPFED